MQTDLAAVGAQVRDLVAQRTQLVVDEGGSDGRTPLAELGVDSIALLSLVTGVEEQFGLEVPDRDVVPEHFGTVDGIVRYVAGRMER